jgi:hypothetical protein
MKPLEFAALIAAGGFVLWILLPPWRSAPPPTPAPTAAPIEAPDARQGRLAHKLCDKEVEALLHASDMVEVERAAAIIQQVNCDIEGRL